MLAELLTCERCCRSALLRVAWICADCIADIGLNHPEQHAAWRADLDCWLGLGCPDYRPQLV